MKTKTNSIKTLEDVRQRKIELLETMEIQKAAIVYGAKDIYDDILPSKVAIQATSSFVSGFVQNISLTQIAITAISAISGKSSKVSGHLRWVIPLFISVVPKIIEFIKDKNLTNRFIFNLKTKAINLFNRLKNNQVAM